MFGLMLIAVLSLSDGLFTLHLIERGATEENPVMAWFLNLGAWPFMTAKFLLTTSAILILLVFHNVYFRPLRIQVKTLIPASAVAFFAVLLWQLLLNFFYKLAALLGFNPHSQTPRSLLNYPIIADIDWPYHLLTDGPDSGDFIRRNRKVRFPSNMGSAPIPILFDFLLRPEVYFHSVLASLPLHRT